MTPTTTPAQPEALRLALLLDEHYLRIGRIDATSAAAELRRLHAQVAALTAAPGGQANTKTHDLLSTMIGLFLGAKEKICYQHGSAIDKTVAEAVEHLKDWPYPETAAPAQPAEGDPDPADIIAGALQTSRGHAIEMMRAAVADLPAEGAAYAPDDTAFLCGKAAGRQEVKDEQQTPDFRSWIHLAYRDPESTAFTIHNMEVAYQAGRASHGKAPAATPQAGSATVTSDNPHNVDRPNEVADYGHDNSVSAAHQTPYDCAKCGEHMGDTDLPKNVPLRKYAVCYKCQAARAPADSVTAPAAGAVAGPTRQQVADRLGFLEGLVTEHTYTRIVDEVAAMLAAAPTPAAQADSGVQEDAAMEAHRKNGLAWAVHRWEDEVKHRPLVNVHRRTLDGTWRQVVRYFEGDPDALLGSSHDAALAQKEGDHE